MFTSAKHRTLHSHCAGTQTWPPRAGFQGTFLSRPDLAEEMRVADEVFVYGPDDAVGALQEAMRNRQSTKV